MFYCDIYNTPAFDETTKDYQIRVYYMEFPTLTEVQVYQPPEKTVYLVGEVLDTYGLLLRAWYSNGAANVVWDELTVQGFDSSKAGISTVTVTYGDQTATFECQIRQRTGDINGDTNINAMDATRILLSTVGKVTLKPEQVQAADVNGDGKINAMDATLILLHTVGKKQIA